MSPRTTVPRVMFIKKAGLINADCQLIQKVIGCTCRTFSVQRGIKRNEHTSNPVKLYDLDEHQGASMKL